MSVRSFALRPSRFHLAALALLGSSHAMASVIVAPHGAGRDADLAGATVASPGDPGSNLLVNPAGVVGDTRDQAMVGLLAFNFTGEYRNDATGYEGSGSQSPMGIDFWYGLGEIGGWSMGVGLYGSIGAAFTLPADPDAGVNSPYTGKLSIINVGFNIGKELTKGLKVGLQISPRYGRQKTQLPSPLGNVEFVADGIGGSATLGMVYEWTPALSLGLSYRSRGFVDMRGDGKVGGVAQDVDVNFVTPASLFGGFAYRWSDNLNLMAQIQWTSYKDFEKGDVEFQTSTALNGPTISNTHDRTRWAVAAEYKVVENSTFRIGYTVGEAMIDDSAVRPNLFDHDNHMIMVGYEIDYGKFMVGFTTGYADLKTRNISASQNANFPGRYDSDSDVSGGFRVTWKLR